MSKRIPFYSAIIFAIVLSLSWTGVISDTLTPPLNELKEIKKLIPPNVILYRVLPQDPPAVDIDPIQIYLAKYKIGSTLSKTLQNDYYTVMRKTLGEEIYGNPNLFMSQCAREIKGYYLSVQVQVTGYTVTVEYTLFDPDKNTILCSNLFKKDYRWSFKRLLGTDMIDRSFDELVNDMYNQLKMQNSELVELSSTP